MSNIVGAERPEDAKPEPGGWIQGYWISKSGYGCCGHHNDGSSSLVPKGGVFYATGANGFVLCMKCAPKEVVAPEAQVKRTGECPCGGNWGVCEYHS